MILSMERSFAFIHVPHTGGTSIEAAYAPHAVSGDLVYGDCHQNKHDTARQLKSKLGREFDSLTVIAIARNPWDRIHSHYYHAIRDFAVIDKLTIPKSYANTLEKISKYKSFADFVRDYWLTKPVDSWQYYCCDHDGKRLVNYIIRFEHLQSAWQTISATMGLRRVELPHINHVADRPDYRSAYDEKLRDQVGEFCAVEINSYRYQF